MIVFSKQLAVSINWKRPLIYQKLFLDDIEEKYKERQKEKDLAQKVLKAFKNKVETLTELPPLLSYSGTETSYYKRF